MGSNDLSNTGDMLPSGEKRNGRQLIESRRKEVIDILTEGFSRNLLDMEEFEQRIEAAERAETAASLETLVADLPAVPAERESGREPAVRELDDEEETYLGIMSSRKLKGDWLKSSRNRIFSVMSEQHFDFRETEFPRVPVEIRVTAIMSEVVVVVPPGVAVRVDTLPIMAECKEDRGIRRKPDRKGDPLVRITGVAFMSSIVVKQKT